LQNSPPTTLTLPAEIHADISAEKANAALRIVNGSGYARLVRIRAEWPTAGSPYLTMFSDNYFDLLPGEEKSLALEMFLPAGHGARIAGTLTVEGPNIVAKTIPLELRNP